MSASRGRDRRHQFPGRRRALLLRCTDEEYDVLVDAASRAGLTTSGYAAEAAIAAARDTEPPKAEPWRQALAEVMSARAQVRKYGSNVNQAVRMLNSTGEAPDWLHETVHLVERAVSDLDSAATQLTRRLR